VSQEGIPLEICQRRSPLPPVDGEYFGWERGFRDGHEGKAWIQRARAREVTGGDGSYELRESPVSYSAF